MPRGPNPTPRVYEVTMVLRVRQRYNIRATSAVNALVEAAMSVKSGINRPDVIAIDSDVESVTTRGVRRVRNG